MNQKAIIKVIIHSLFWISYISVLVVLNPLKYDAFYTSTYPKIEISFLLLVLSITYLNDLFLLPYFFKKKSFALYSVIAFGLILLVAFLYCYYVLGFVDSLFACYSDDLWIIALPFVLLSFIWVVLEFSEKQIELDQAKRERVESELKFLKAQINPHVLFNSLNTIYAKAIKENDEIAELILILSDNLKYVLNTSNDTFVNLEKEIIFIENYLEFQKLRTQGINNIIYNKEVDSYNHSFAPLILIDFIENAFKYSIFRDEGQSDIIINLKINNGSMQFTCMNEFDPDFVDKENNETTQIGLKNLEKRLELIYQNKYDLRIIWAMLSKAIWKKQESTQLNQLN